MPGLSRFETTSIPGIEVPDQVTDSEGQTYGALSAYDIAMNKARAMASKQDREDQEYLKENYPKIWQGMIKFVERWEAEYGQA